MAKQPTTSTEPTTTANEPTEKKLGKFVQIEREAMADYVPREPYVIDDVEPPIVITEPVETGRIVAIISCLNQVAGGVPEELVFEPMLRAVCGDAYDRVWTELLADKHFNVTGTFIEDVRKHFAPDYRTAAQSSGDAFEGE
ncbi:hypothetical protein [Rhodococcus sp. ACT016]|uniref:hypothetical protein n=1 Tax=Rhodococcus sp. ACT016 TaxID=3134808 RepID=UPI003D2A7B3C